MSCHRLEGKIAIVTGGASGIGEATVRRFLDEGAEVVIADIRSDAIETLIASLGSDRVAGFTVDMLDLSQVEAMIAFAVERYGRLDILVNNAGIGSFGRITEIDLAHWREVLGIDLDAVQDRLGADRAAAR